MGEFFKIQYGNSGNGCPNGCRSPAFGRAEGFAFRSRRAFRPVSGDLSNRRQPHHAQQVVSPRYKVAPGLGSFQSPIPAPSKPSHRLDPTKDFLHPLANLQTDLVTPLRRGAPVQSGHPHFVFARHVRRDRPRPAALHKTFLVIATIIRLKHVENQLIA